MEQRRKTRAFTLAELLIVITLIGILMSMVSLGLGAAKRHAMRTKAEAQLRDLTKAWMQYYIVYTNFPLTGGVTIPPNQSSLSAGSVLWYPMTYANMQPLMASGNSKQIPFISMRLDGVDYQDPWHNTYWVGFPDVTALTQTQTNMAAMHISVVIPNFNRYRNN